MFSFRAYSWNSHFPQIYTCITNDWASLVGQLVKKKNSPALWETWVQSLAWEDPLEKDIATHSSGLSFPADSGGKSIWLQ